MMSKKFNLQTSIISLIVGWLVLFVLIPNLMIIITSFLTRDEANLIELTFTFDNYLRLLDPLYAKVMLHSFYMAIVATILCLIIGYPFAYIVAKMPEKWRPIMLFLVIVPFWTNSLIRTYGLKIVLGTQGILNKALLDIGLIDAPLRLMYTETAVMIGLVYILLPFMILPLYSAIEKLDDTYIEAARDLGANKFQTLTKVILPLTMPGIIGGCLLVLLPALGMFYISDLLGGAKNLLIGNVIKSQVLNARDWPFGAATSIALTIAMAIMLYAYYRAGKLLNKKVELD
ncbi:ABC-type spermidine/putrescine transport system permease subunit I [Vibrio diazotrophicus]|jgi:spermidine/putrescine transport system permease protein|uniref:Spermidine/putrescine transport system permease protein PotB n=2 Tax=Vibrio TaxID=662 RepID=A0A2J8GMV0_VIBDI|nr:spermidine/putrescine ABC transporter permease PotB [Vibrio plantisponsor]PNH87355.1 spermidine/putrescine ABC transporter permease PotB [Vibrio diazotrophicus]RAS61399.1 ABC-type spermidine/putrescine transport system permease subunit I [Vibrio diazotrophicus]